MRATGPVLALTALVLLVAALPDLLRQGLLSQPPGRTLSSSSAGGSPALPEPGLRPLALLEDGLLERLKQADQAWIPRAEPLPEGGVRYLYRRRPGDPELTIPQIRALIAQPPDHGPEHQAIVRMLTTLERLGVAVGLVEPIKPGAAAEWDPQARTLRIRPDVPDQGSVEFARVLNHETIHVAQSCAGGGVGAMPRPLGLLPRDGRSASGKGGQGSSLFRSAVEASAGHQLEDPIYADLSPAERLMELEAYNHQNRLDLGVTLLRIHCLDGQPG